MSEHIVDTFGIVQDFADLHDSMNTPLYEAIMGVMVSRQREEIVRCRDCKYAVDSYYGCRYFSHMDLAGDYRWKEAPAEVESDGFCAWGERRDV